MKKWRLRLSYYWYRLLMKLGLKTDEVYYIGGSEALPPPLSKDEEELLFRHGLEGALLRSAGALGRGTCIWMPQERL